MNDAWRAAELLEEIAMNADPTVVLRREIEVLRNNARSSGVITTTAISEKDFMVSMSFSIPVDVVMRGVNGTPQEVMEWLQTGLDADHTVSFGEIDGKPQFTILQMYYDRQMYDRVRGLFDDLNKAFWERNKT